MLIKPEQLVLWNKSTKILAGTGHRPDKLGNEYELVGPISSHLRKEVQKYFDLLKPTKVISGMALGFDQLLALAAIDNNIPVLAAIPCETQEKMWPQKSKDRYFKMLANPLVETKVISYGPYHPGMMQVRNIWMCDQSDVLLAAWDGTSGGTANCIKYARKQDMGILYISLDLNNPIADPLLFD